MVAEERTRTLETRIMIPLFQTKLPYTAFINPSSSEAQGATPGPIETPPHMINSKPDPEMPSANPVQGPRAEVAVALLERVGS